ncbi:MAG: hypothetical protein GC164_09705 [Phycisphaera sp.]|nr:hypothetical protein [Phycisphaera sp.]
MSADCSDNLLDRAFPRYTRFDPAVPVWCVTPHEGRIFHRFFDTPPISPNGRYLVAFRMPFEDRLPQPGDEGHIIVVDLHTGTEKTVATTRGWEPQLGANQQWCGDDQTLVFNDVDTDTWQPLAIKLNCVTGERTRLTGGVYHASPDGKFLLHCSLEKMRRTQSGYGVVVPDQYVPINHGLPDDDGLFITNTQTGEHRLMVSIHEAFTRCADQLQHGVDYAGGEAYGFHAKWSPDGQRILFSIRWRKADCPMKWCSLGNDTTWFNVFTLNADGSNLRCAMPAPRWKLGGHHINFYPDGQKLSANVNLNGDGLKLMRVNLDGSGFEPITTDIPGSGHPTVHPDGRHLLTDVYAHESMAYSDGTGPLRWIDTLQGTEQSILRIASLTPWQKSVNSALRLDPHPAWDRQWRYVVFNGFEGGTRRVYVADMVNLLEQTKPGITATA